MKVRDFPRWVMWLVALSFTGGLLIAGATIRCAFSRGKVVASTSVSYDANRHHFQFRIRRIPHSFWNERFSETTVDSIYVCEIERDGIIIAVNAFDWESFYPAKNRIFVRLADEDENEAGRQRAKISGNRRVVFFLDDKVISCWFDQWLRLNLWEENAPEIRRLAK